MTYTFYVRNGADPPLDASTTASVERQPSPTTSAASPTYVSGDTNGNRKLETDETWAFRAR